ncbi:type I phosphomannose isomerase catalytic subunit [Wenyingzhuangia sp. IMCC45533]
MNKKKLYPLKFNSIFFEKIWGGHKIKETLKKDFGKLSNCGESWELSGEKSNISVVKNGPLAGTLLTDLIKLYGKDLLGNGAFNSSEFPLLIKFIDADEDLSVQVHPNDEIAQVRHASRGKTEMWYVIDADEETSLISGFNKKTNQIEFLDKLSNNTLPEILNRELVKKDDVFFLPAGRIHTIGKGSLILEIQQSSDITYRIYDFDRIGLDGKKRKLHIQESLDVIDYDFHSNYKTRYQNSSNERIQLTNCEYFVVNKLNINKTLVLKSPNEKSFTVYISIKGHSKIMVNNEEYHLHENELILIPACIKEYEFVPASSEATIIETYIP